MSTTIADAPPGAAPTSRARAQATVGRRSLPSGRAVLGGLLVTVAALGTYLAAAGSDGGPTGTYVVARRTVDAGHRLTLADLRTVAGDLPDEVARTTYPDPRELEGSVALAPLDAGNLVQRSAVRTSDGDDDGGREVSLRLPRAQAIDGDLVRGERVDVLATYGSGPDAATHVVARRALVTHIGREDGAALGDDGGLTLTLRLPDDPTVLRTIHAKDVAVVTLVRATERSAEEQPPSADRYRGPDIPPTDEPSVDDPVDQTGGDGR